MAKKRTKADKLQRNVERLEKRDDAGRESEINEKRSRPTSKIPVPPQRESETEDPGDPAKSGRLSSPKDDKEDFAFALARRLLIFTKRPGGDGIRVRSDHTFALGAEVSSSPIVN